MLPLCLCQGLSAAYSTHDLAAWGMALLLIHPGLTYMPVNSIHSICKLSKPYLQPAITDIRVLFLLGCFDPKAVALQAYH